MIKQINLLPWREYRRQKNKKNFIVVLIVAISLAISIVFSLDAWIINKIKVQRKFNNELQTKIDLLGNKTNEIQELIDEKQKIMIQLTRLNEFHNNKYSALNLFVELISRMPNEIYFTHLKREENEIIVSGKAQSNTNVSDFMKNIEGSSSFAQPVLREIKTGTKNYDNDFILQFQQK